MLKRRSFKKILIFAVVFISSTGYYSTTASAATKKSYYNPRSFARALVTNIERVKNQESENREIRVHLRILDGDLKDETRVSVYGGEDEMPKDIFYKKGDTVFIGISKMETEDGREILNIYDVDNTPGIIIMGIMLIATIIAIGRFRGVLSMVSLIATIFLLFYILIPFTLKGYPPLPIALGIALFSLFISIPIIMGFQKKTIAAILGASSGVLLATILSVAVGWIMHLSGIVTNEMLTVFYASSIDIDLRGLALSAIVISALGAIMDVCISIASATEEFFKVNPDISRKDAFKSVMTVSSDMLGATVNTLLFAYVGSALPMVLFIAIRIDAAMPLTLILNYNPVLSELIKSAIGCIGMFLAMPATAFFCIELHGRGKFKE